MSWKRKPQATGSCQFSAKRCSASAAAASQPLPPAITSGRWAASSRARNSRSAPGAGQACATDTSGSTGAVVGVLSMSSGSARTTGPGRPCSAVWKARATYSGNRSARSTSAAHFAMPSVPGPNSWR